MLDPAAPEGGQAKRSELALPPGQPARPSQTVCLAAAPQTDSRGAEGCFVRYSPGLKSNMVRKMVGPNRVSATALGRDVGIPQSTLSRWLQGTGAVAGVASAPSPQESEDIMTSRRPRDWPAEEKLKAVIDAQSLCEEELGAFLRRKGLHEAQLQEWRTIILAGLRGQPVRPSAHASAEGRRIRELERELDRKDKALAETAALLVLKKKARAIWGDEDAPTGKKSAK